MSAPPDTRRLAVALQYDRQGAPRVTAKGRGATAEKIIETAKSHDIPLEDDPVLAEALAKIPLDDEIPVELYRAVATVIGFVLRHRRGPAR
ncbi:EscU/YscU/HrcU family type III secretion system export apparatus switch protein [uncultured Alsobacter sp.]|uniref:EscU/YscU/HrcU family type III secretion system export apparatus switch protein n=1 Tax=uncultured Alsobacter sp. TaxID=1748258 RepID=UPI0025FD2BB7|nr:EscU/YscU/HrcU family type III secretion system export apparatus switch protein [uncultured Alsobacter sp.]